mmetsp:Transcript_5949/g.18445  ORF Transcript_5949/g.18445 Transcript_5949/m.18445 type:complete len:201 (-) Transcript_5949:450-1052(-)
MSVYPVVCGHQSAGDLSAVGPGPPLSGPSCLGHRGAAGQGAPGPLRMGRGQERHGAVHRQPCEAAGPGLLLLGGARQAALLQAVQGQGADARAPGAGGLEAAGLEHLQDLALGEGAHGDGDPGARVLQGRVRNGPGPAHIPVMLLLEADEAQGHAAAQLLAELVLVHGAVDLHLEVVDHAPVGVAELLRDLPAAAPEQQA